MKSVLNDSYDDMVKEKLPHTNYYLILRDILKAYKYDKGLSWLKNFKRVAIPWFTEFYGYYDCTFDFATLINLGLTYRWDRPPVPKEVMEQRLMRTKKLIQAEKDQRNSVGVYKPSYTEEDQKRHEQGIYRFCKVTQDTYSEFRLILTEYPSMEEIYSFRRAIFRECDRDYLDQTRIIPQVGFYLGWDRPKTLTTGGTIFHAFGLFSQIIEIFSDFFNTFATELFEVEPRFKEEFIFERFSDWYYI